MPWARLEIAKLLVDLVELSEQLGDQTVGRAVIGEKIVTDAMPPGPPDQLVAIEAEKIASGLQVRPIAQLERRVKMPVRVDLHQVDGVMVAATTQEREEISHPIGLAKAENVAIELGHVLHVSDEERDVAELVGNDALGREALSGEGLPLEHLHYSPLRILERNHVRDRGLGILAPLGLDAVALHLLLERAEIVVGRDLESEAHTFRLRALMQHHGMMIDGRGEIHGILALVSHREADHVGVIFDLLVDIRHFVNGVGDLLDADHADLRSLFPSIQALARGSAPMTSTIAATSFSPNPIAMNLS